MISARSTPTPRWVRRFAVAALVLGITGLLLVGDDRAAFGGPTDPRADQVRALLERQGYRVREVKVDPAGGAARAEWRVSFDARYTQPTYKEMQSHFIAGWWAITSVAAADPDSVLFVTQVWRTYRIRLRAGLKPAAALIQGLQTAKTDAEWGKVLRTFMRSVEFLGDLDVWDEARQADIPTLDFLAANIKDDSPQAARTIPHFVAARIKVGLEQQGLKNIDVHWYDPENGIARWRASSAATYARPSYDAVYGQAHKAWWVLHKALTGYEDSTVLEARQVWRQYQLQLATNRAAYARLLKDLEAGGTAAARAKAFEAFRTQVDIGIWDLEDKKFIPTQEFVRQYFGR